MFLAMGVFRLFYSAFRIPVKTEDVVKLTCFDAASLWLSFM